MVAKFFYLEGAYLILAGLILLVTLFVTTRPFMSKDAPKKGLLTVGGVGIFINNSIFIFTGLQGNWAEGKKWLCNQG